MPITDPRTFQSQQEKRVKAMQSMGIDEKDIMFMDPKNAAAVAAATAAATAASAKRDKGKSPLEKDRSGASSSAGGNDNGDAFGGALSNPTKHVKSGAAKIIEKKRISLYDYSITFRIGTTVLEI